MKKKIVSILIMILLIVVTFFSMGETRGKNSDFEVGLRYSSIVNINLGKQTIYVDTSGIDVRGDLTNEQKNDLKDKVLDHIRKNVESAVGKENVEVTNDKTKEKDANRKIDIKNDFASPKGSCWGDRVKGSDTGTVYLKEFLDDAAVNGDFKTGGKWDTTKLSNGIGGAGAHELAHTFCVGHNTSAGAGNKMADGSKMDKNGDGKNSDELTDSNWKYDKHTKDEMKKKWDTKACENSVDYAMKAIDMHYWGDELYATIKTCELGGFNVLFDYSGYLSNQFYFGYLGPDYDDGLVDGNSDFDFLSQSSMDGLGGDANGLTFFDGPPHNYYQFLLQGVPGGDWENQWFFVQEENVILDTYVENPSGEVVARRLTMQWYIDEYPGYDVEVILDANAFGEYSNPYNGFTYEIPDKPDTIIYLDEDFSTWIPDGWSTDDFIQYDSNYAGGESPEAKLEWLDIVDDYSYLSSKTVDTSAACALSLEFKSKIDDYYGQYTCKVLARAGVSDLWSDVTPWANPISGDLGSDTYTVDITGQIGTATEIKFEFIGDYYNIYYWFIDDVVIYSYGEDAFCKWKDGGTEYFETEVIKKLNIPILGQKEIQVVLRGPTTIDRLKPEKNLDDGRWQIETEIISMDLKGHILGMPIQVRESPDKHSTGIIRQITPGVDFPAESFFDVYVEIQTPLPRPFNIIYNKGPVIMSNIIDYIPPYLDNYTSNNTPVPLYTKTGIFSNRPIGYIVNASHLLPPKPSELEVEIIRPKEGYLYIFDFELIPFQRTMIVGPITIEAESDSPLDKVEFYINGNLKNIDSSPPYSWIWNEKPVYLQNLIKVIAYDNVGSKAIDDMVVVKFF